MRKLNRPDFDLRWIEGDYGCWLWTGNVKGESPGRPAFGGSHGSHGGYASRWIYEHEFGLILPGMEIAHLCHNRMCVNPDHLAMLTPKQNAAMERLLTCSGCGNQELKLDHRPQDRRRKNADCSCPNGRCAECRARQEVGI